MGSTGSIGTSTLEVVSHLGKPYRIVAMTAARSWQKLAQQALQVRPKVVVLSDPETEEDFAQLKKILSPKRISVQRGPDAASDIAARSDVDIVAASVVGAAGLAPVLAAAKAGKCIALSNKETLVAAGSLMMPLLKKHNASLVPVDSEHSAIFQALRSGEPKEIRRIILTASGGPFRTWPVEKIQNATVE
ncbi:MAG TPA: 1-deoxy-D-xylulose-5-phosphate reductoisomerase, partial [Phycisphaerae bacterium]|nr:1-deoxy-D-xylulose-5-phosphate reductoisomerase [Phycisphaerae bacterium]